MLNRGVPRLCVRWSNSISYMLLYIEGKDGERHNATISKPNIHTTHIIQLSHLIIFNKPQYDRGLKIQHKSRADKSARRNDDSLCTRQMTWLVSVWPLNIISWFVINLILVCVCMWLLQYNSINSSSEMMAVNLCQCQPTFVWTHCVCCQFKRCSLALWVFIFCSAVFHESFNIARWSDIVDCACVSVCLCATCTVHRRANVFVIKCLPLAQ